MPMTPDEDGLLAAISAAPRDDAPRLIYADWLQERGADAKADYLRTVVRLMHPPEDPADVARCLALAAELDADWRSRVGGRFEIVLEGAPPLLLLAHVLRAVVSLALHEVAETWQSGKPVRLESGLTREDAERRADAFRVKPLLESVSEEAPIRFVVRLTEDDPGRGLVALPAGPRK